VLHRSIETARSKETLHKSFVHSLID
jgi:hypothetical protein